MPTLAFLLVLLQAMPAASAVPAPDSLSIYYVTAERATLYSRPDSARPYVQLTFREHVFLQDQQGHWSHVKTRDGARGFVHASALSNVWLRVSKRNRTLYVYRGTKLVEQIPVDLGFNRFADKERRGSDREPDHWRTPEGAFFVAAKNPRSNFHKAFVLNYPAAEDADRGLQQGLITPVEHASIVRAESEFRMPPMNTALGGWIEIHGRGTGARTDWTQGCVAIRDSDIDRIWSWVDVGTPVLIER